MSSDFAPFGIIHTLQGRKKSMATPGEVPGQLFLHSILPVLSFITTKKCPTDLGGAWSKWNCGLSCTKFPFTFSFGELAPTHLAYLCCVPVFSGGSCFRPSTKSVYQRRDKRRNNNSGPPCWCSEEWCKRIKTILHIWMYRNTKKKKNILKTVFIFLSLVMIQGACFSL